MGDSDGWCSPPLIVTPLVDFFDGMVSVDPCSNARSIVPARAAYTFGGLVRPWLAPDAPRTCYENPPYSLGGPWTVKALAELACGNVEELVRLTMLAGSTEWWADMCTKPERNPRILALRKFKFLNPEASGRTWTCRFDPALTYIGHRPELFTKTFAHLTRWAAWGR